MVGRRRVLETPPSKKTRPLGIWLGTSLAIEVELARTPNYENENDSPVVGTDGGGFDFVGLDGMFG